MRSTPALLLLVRPFRGYEELARAEKAEAPTPIEGALRLLLVIGAVVSLTATGRLAPIELVVAMVSFAYVPAVELLAVTLALRATHRTYPLTKAWALFLAGRGPWMLTLLAVAALALLSPRPADVLLVTVPPLVLATFVWSTVVTYACFRRGIALSGARAGLATAIYSVALVALVLAYYLVMGQLGPLLRSR